MGQGHDQFCFVSKNTKELAKNFLDIFSWKMLEFCGKFTKFLSGDLFFGDYFLNVSLVLGLEHSCPWPREGLSLEEPSLASDCFCVCLALASSLMSSTPPVLPSRLLDLPFCKKNIAIQYYNQNQFI